MVKKNIPNPKTEYGVIKRYLHVLALLQNGSDPHNWNASTLADVLSLDEDADCMVTDKNIRDYIRGYLKKELGVPVSTVKGGRRTGLAGGMEEDLLEQIAGIYSSFVVRDSTREIVLKSFIKKHSADALWVLARIYFATLERRRIMFDYVNNAGLEIRDSLCQPYHMVFRNNNLYLVARVTGRDAPWLFIMNRMTNLRVTDEYFDEAIPPLDFVFQDTLGSFIGRKYDVVLRFSDRVRNPMEQFLSILEPGMKRIDEGTWEARFSVSDSIYLCMKLFSFGSDAEIIDPKEIRDAMIAMLKNSLDAYS